MGSPELLKRPAYAKASAGRSGDGETGRNCGTIKTTPEQIVREFRIAGRGVRIESVKEPVSKLERAIQIFLIFVFGWGFGYLHHFLAAAR
jgi:hypothetical protein